MSLAPLADLPRRCSVGCGCEKPARWWHVEGCLVSQQHVLCDDHIEGWDGHGWREIARPDLDALLDAAVLSPEAFDAIWGKEVRFQQVLHPRRLGEGA